MLPKNLHNKQCFVACSTNKSLKRSKLTVTLSVDRPVSGRALRNRHDRQITRLAAKSGDHKCQDRFSFELKRRDPIGTSGQKSEVNEKN